MAARPSWQVWTSHVLAVLVGLMFLMGGGTKLMGEASMVANFERWGYPGWFVYFTGLLEVLGAVLLVLPRTRVAGGLLLGVVMIAATVTHLLNGEASAVVAPIVLGALAGISAFLALPRE